MFISKEQVSAMTGYEVTSELLAQAQTMIEVWVGKTESEVENATDLDLLGRAVAFQAVYMKSNTNVVLEQIAVKTIISGETTYSMNPDMFAPFISPWAWKACSRLTWMRSRSVKTGPVHDVPRPVDDWRTV